MNKILNYLRPCYKYKTMNGALQKVFWQLEKQRKELQARINHLPEERFNKSMERGKWSIAQILTHLVTSERLSLGYMKKKIQGAEQAGNSGIWEEIKLVILIISQRLPLKFRAPKVVTENTPPALSKQELFSLWENSRSELKNFLEATDERHTRKLIFKHPVAGRLDVRQALVFFGEHIRHHRPQINRLLRKM